jgi:hypothetical protein
MTAMQVLDSTEVNTQADALRKVLGSPSMPAKSGKTGSH